MSAQRALLLAILVVAVSVGYFLVNFQSGSALVDAVANGNLESVNRLIEEGHDVDAFGKDDWTPLTTAVENDDSDMVRFLLRNGADPNKIVPGGTALDMALRRNRTGPAQVIREFGGHCKNACDLEKEI